MIGTEYTDPTAQGGEEQYRLLMENVKDYAIFMLDTRGKIVTWNTGAERILCYQEREILGQSFSRIFTPEDVANSQPEFELHAAIEDGRSEDERWHVRKDGTRFWASGVLTALWDQEGRLRGFAKLLRDITERKQMEKELADANRRKDEFLAMLAHELRNPLAPILNAVQLIRQEADGRPALQRAGGMIDRQVRRLMRLVDDLLDVSRITQGKIQLRRERAELRGIVNRAVETARPFIDSRKHELSVSLPAEAIWLDADPARLEQVVVNLLNNAAKYTEPGGHIWLTVEREGPEAVLRVTDTGIGIQAEMLPRVFDLFVQADGSLARAQGGLGVGLTLVKRLVEMHGGRVIAQSEGVGRGSEFSVRLPTLPEITALPSEAVPKRPQEVGTPLRVLVVDDNVDTAESLAMLLRRYGHDVEVAHTGPTALRLAQEHPPDVVLLDIGLPGMDGLQVAHKLRQQERMENVRLIATTGYGSDCDRQHCHDAGFDYHLLKPVDFAKLQELLGELGKQLHKE